MAKLTCEVCGITSDERTSWVTWCPIHFGDVCEKCCYGCKYMMKIASLVHCSFKDRENEKREPS